jgi:xyloglucan-specific endo-beta-1,4-glucanase
MTDRICEHEGSIARAPFLLSNNLWGASTGRGSQCLSADTAQAGSGSVAWGTDWSWEGDPNTVKSYVACTLGWHWGWPLPGGPLPARLDDLAAVPSAWTYRLSASRDSRLNVTYDIWLSAVPDPGSSDPGDEVMIWLRHEGDPTPIGQPRGSIEVEGATWELWRGPHPERGWAVHSFVRTEPADASRLDLMRFFAAIRPEMPSAAYLVGVEAGAEVFRGSGRLDTTAYTLELVRR